MATDQTHARAKLPHVDDIESEMTTLVKICPAIVGSKEEVASFLQAKGLLHQQMTSPSSVPSGASFVGSTRQEYAGTKTSLRAWVDGFQ